MIDDLPPGAKLEALHDDTKRLLRDSQEVDEQAVRLKKLEEKVANLSLLSEALWELLTTKTKLTDDDLTAIIPTVIQKRKQREEIKLTCVKCKMQNSVNHKKCVYCGGELIGQPGKRAFQF